MEPPWGDVGSQAHIASYDEVTLSLLWDRMLEACMAEDAGDEARVLGARRDMAAMMRSRCLPSDLGFVREEGPEPELVNCSILTPPLPRDNPSLMTQIEAYARRHRSAWPEDMAGWVARATRQLGLAAMEAWGNRA